MNRVKIHAGKEYEVLIGSGLAEECGALISRVSSAKQIMLVSDDTVWSLYGESVRGSLREAGFTVHTFVFPHGENSKNLKVYGELLEALCEAGCTRNDLVAALGGGVCGDLAGFAAATYQRGCGLVQIPTTLLAAVDSSVGGKTAIDLPNGKNQAGCFYQPLLVICDTALLETLPEEEYENGCAEIIKYAMLDGEELFRQILETPVRAQYEEIITRCVSIKRDYVEDDEFDRGRRMLLNFGHTLGHAAELLSRYEIPHGRAVAMGMAAVTRASAEKGMCPAELPDRLETLLKAYGLPVKIPYEAGALSAAARSDKKNMDGIMRIIVPEAVGRTKCISISQTEMTDWLSSEDRKSRMVTAGRRSGSITAPVSKSAAQRALITSALSKNGSRVLYGEPSKDIEAAVRCLDGLLGVNAACGEPCRLDPGESGAVLRFLLPVAAALGIRAEFCPQGSLIGRPVEPLSDVLRSHGAMILEEKKTEDGKTVSQRFITGGRLLSGDYEIPGNVSSQFVSGLLFALPLLTGDSTLRVTGTVESASYIEMTERELRRAGISFEKNGWYYRIPGGQKYDAPEQINAEGDWSGAAVFLCMGAFSEKGITVSGLDTASGQGDRRILEILKAFGAEVILRKDTVTVRKGRPDSLYLSVGDNACAAVSDVGMVRTIDVSGIPDLVPVISVLAAGTPGVTEITNAGRLRLKESDRLSSVAAMLGALDVKVTEEADGLEIEGREYGRSPAENESEMQCPEAGTSGIKDVLIDSRGDHRIAMAAALAAAVTGRKLRITDAACVDKSYPAFWHDFDSLEVEHGKFLR